VQSGADLIGFMFAPSKRRIDHGHARACLEAIRSAVSGHYPLAIGVFVDASLEEIATAIEVVGLDLVQLHGSPPRGVGWSRGSRLGAASGTPYVQAIATPPGTTLADALQHIAAQRATDSAPVAWMIDGYHPGLHGGTGKRADWDLAAEIAAVAPLILAGGLTPENVADAIRHVRPLGVDVSGGVETDGRKDPAKIVAFVAAARAAFDGDGVAPRSPA
jgi:phosphoribosylanthranilate isomerase